MKLPFPSYQTTFTCDCTMQEAIERILSCVSQDSWGTKLIDSYYDGSQNIIFESRFGVVSRRNVTLPIVNVKITPVGEKSEVSIIFEYKYLTKLFYAIYLGALLSFTLFYLTISVINRVFPEVMFITIIVFMVLLILIGTPLSVKSSSKTILLTLLDALNYNYNGKDFLPQLQRVKFFNSIKNKKTDL